MYVFSYLIICLYVHIDRYRYIYIYTMGPALCCWPERWGIVSLGNSAPENKRENGVR